MRSLMSGRKCGCVADEAQPHAAAVQFVDLAVERAHEQLHQRADFLLRAPQFSLEKANRVSASMPRSRHQSMQRLTARAPARWPMCAGAGAA
jgi:hypothetical protein